jgi:hypothetical protein
MGTGKIGANSQKITVLFAQNCHQALKNVGLGSEIPDPGVKKAPDSGSSRLQDINNCIQVVTLCV